MQPARIMLALVTVTLGFEVPGPLNGRLASAAMGPKGLRCEAGAVAWQITAKTIKIFH
jgi:hypothetical protein